jgi:hypothetical protein
MGTTEESQYLWESAALIAIVDLVANGAVQRSVGILLGPIVGRTLLGMLLDLTPTAQLLFMLLLLQAPLPRL